MKQVTYKCDCCKQEFVSGRERKGEKLCAECIGFRRFLKGLLKRGVSEEQVLRRAKKLVAAKAESKQEAEV